MVNISKKGCDNLLVLGKCPFMENFKAIR